MKNLFPFLLMIILCLAIGGCKKDDAGNDNNTSQSFTPAYIPPSQPGIIQVSASQIQLHLNNSVIISAELYYSNGLLFSAQPAFVWGSNNATVATVSAGTIQANALGNATISVTDGSHGLAYINVQVIADTISILTELANIAFNPPIVVVEVNQTATFNYSTTNLQGQVASGSLSFRAMGNASGITISGSSISAANKTGVFIVKAFINNVPLAGSLYIQINDPAAYNPSDTGWIVSEVELVSFPGVFFSFNKESDPVRMTVFERRNCPPGTFDPGGLCGRIRQTSPELLIIHHPEVISGSSSGTLISKTYGSTNIKAQYKDFTVSWDAGVAFPFTSTWSATYQGHTYNFCILQEKSGIIYNQSTAVCGTDQSGSINYVHDLCGFPQNVELLARNEIVWSDTKYSIDTCSGGLGVDSYDLNFLNHGIISDNDGQPDFSSYPGFRINPFNTSFCIPACNNQSAWRVNLAPKDNDHLHAYPCYSSTGQDERFVLTRSIGNCASDTTNTTDTTTYSFRGTFTFQGTTHQLYYVAGSCSDNSVFFFDNANPSDPYSNDHFEILNVPHNDGTYNYSTGWSVSVFVDSHSSVIHQWTTYNGTLIKAGNTITINATIYDFAFLGSVSAAPKYPFTATVTCP